jgi:WD40 repeat protein/serine/threonine protein kinase
MSDDPKTIPPDEFRTIASPGLAEQIASAHLEKPGDLVGPYTLVSLLGEGGFGSVWLAERKVPFLQKVALKLVKAGMDSRSVLTRFEQERQTLAAMSHHNVATLIDGGLTPAGRPYFAMEFVKGKPINEFCDENGLATKDRLKLFLQVCDAVQHAHTKGVIHRDLKPGNILVSTEGGEHPNAKVIDFGVAKALTQQASESEMMTETGSMVGTPEYMSPEQAESNAIQIDTRTDVYSLGVILYELLTGLLPFDSKELRAKGYREIQRVITEVDPPTPSVRLTAVVARDRDRAARIEEARGVAIASLAKDLKSELEWIPLKAMRKEPKERYQSAVALAEDIGNYLDGKPLVAAPESAAYRFRKYVRRNKAIAIGSGAVLAALVFGLALATWQWWEASVARNLAQQSERQAIAARDAADAARKEVEENAYLANVKLAGNAAESQELKRTRGYLAACPPSLRGWEWAWLGAGLDRSLATLGTHGGEVFVSAFSPDGTRILTVADDRIVRVFDTATARLLAELAGHEAQVVNAAFSPDGARIASTSTDGTVRLWDVAKGTCLATLFGHAGPVYLAAYRPDGKTIATASADGTARTWDAGTGAALRTLSGHGGPVATVQFSPDGQRIVTASTDGTARTWDAASGETVAVLEGHGSEVLVARFSPDGRQVVTGAKDVTGRIFDAESGAIIARLDGHDESIPSVRFSPDGTRVLTASVDRTARIWDAASGATIVEIRDHGAPLFSAEFSPDGKRVLTASLLDPIARVWDAATGLPLAELKGHEQGLFTARFSPDGRSIATSSIDRTARLWQAATPPAIRELGGHAGLVRSAVPSGDGTRLVTTSESPVARVWNVDSGEFLFDLVGHANEVSSPKFSPDGTIIATASRDGTARTWNAATGAPLRTLAGHRDRVVSTAFSPDGRDLLTASHDGTARIWRLDDGSLRHELAGHGGRISFATYSPDGSTVVTVSEDKTARLWDAATGSPLRTIEGHGEGVQSAAFSGDGSSLLTLSLDRTARLWRVDTGEPLVTVDGHEVRAARLSPDGRTVATGSRDGSILLSDARTGAVRHRLMTAGVPVLSVNFSPDGSRLVTTGTDNAARVWDVASGEVLARLVAGRDGMISAGFTPDGTRLVTASADGVARIWDAVPNRVRFVERQAARSGTPDELGSAFLPEIRGEREKTWVSDPSLAPNRPDFRRPTDPDGLPVAEVSRLLRASLEAGRIGPALEAARSWGVEGIGPGILAALARGGVAGLPAGDPRCDLDTLLAYAESAVGETARRDDIALESLAIVREARGETAKAAETYRETIRAIEAKPTPEKDDAKAAQVARIAALEAKATELSNR